MIGRTVSTRTLLFVVMLAVLLCIATNLAFAARQEPPSGNEIAEKAKIAKFDTENSTTGQKSAKQCKLTPADLSSVKNLEELENGQILGKLDTQLPGDETNLPAGKYNLFLTKVGGEWRVFAESKGKILSEAKRVQVDFEQARERELKRSGEDELQLRGVKMVTPSKKPKFNPDGWHFCVNIFAWGVWFNACFWF